MGERKGQVGGEGAAELDAGRRDANGVSSEAVENEHELRVRLLRAEESLSEHAARWLFAIEGTGVGVLDWDIRTGAMEFSDRWLAITGYSREEIVPRFETLTSLVHPDDLPMALADAEEVLAGRKAVHRVEHRLKHRQGHWIWVQSRSLVTAWSDDHEPLRMIGTHVDITDRKRAEEALRESESRFRVLADGAPIVLFVDDAESGTQFVNRTYCDYFGVTAAQVEADGWRPLVHPDDAPGYVAEVMKAVEERLPFRAEVRVRRADGAWRLVETVAEPRLAPGGEYLGHVGILIDITDRKQGEEERARLQQQLLESQAIESIGRLAGGVAHDFNNMLGVILGHVELALANAAGTPVEDDLMRVREAAKRSAGLIRQLLAFARKQPISPLAIDLNERVPRTLAMLRRLIGENIQLRWQPAPALWSVRMDPSQVDQILTNLCVNARDAIDAVGTIAIEGCNVAIDAASYAAHPEALPGDYVRLSVSDDGCGMTDETRTHLFEPFFTTKGVGRGTGLGLATVYGIVKQNGGFLQVESALGAGSRFDIYLPRMREGARPEPAPERPAVPVVSQHATILLVEDEPALLRVSQAMLEDLGYRVFPAPSPSAALRLAKEHGSAIRLVITDVVMPEMNGRQLADHLASSIPGAPVLFMSGYADDRVARHGVLGNARNFLQKPFGSAELATKVREALADTCGGAADPS